MIPCVIQIACHRAFIVQISAAFWRDNISSFCLFHTPVESLIWCGYRIQCCLKNPTVSIFLLIITLSAVRLLNASVISTLLLYTDASPGNYPAQVDASKRCSSRMLSRIIGRAIADEADAGRRNVGQGTGGGTGPTTSSA